ncbi:anhydro-N-acetylmuramic acid kinase [Thalassotalea litorea]|uniref:Anhydro-N-acetylmuramic acid kinase n=1 Tax=Thalassotalea litorea TaxID=2020715 RepID=A0A5R9ITI2_9GAMM|nr:anhydro-N-acetylmuramic acid kinase [Thalassotalea litorea]TLU66641.1 anhydro-N-acetylmuramic acid kinase [Thalassotalea litorea]
MSANKKSQSNLNNSSLYIGLMSGTSADGIDLALVDFAGVQPQLIASHFTPYSHSIRDEITGLYVPGHNEIDRAGFLDKKLAVCFSGAIEDFLAQQQLHHLDIRAIGNHGQTIRHRPIGKNVFTQQIGCSQTLACRTGIRVIGQFRQKDMALGGQGAPLVPAYHQAIFQQAGTDVCIVNIGGISNISFLPGDLKQQICGFDIGPGNALLDDWYRHHHPRCTAGIDMDGQWAGSGSVEPDLLALFKRDPYFSLPFPKSTGREYFHMDWLNTHIRAFEKSNRKMAPENVQATLLALTSDTIAQTITALSQCCEVIVCGGGANNGLLMNSLKNNLAGHTVIRSTDKGVDNDSLEAVVFAWLARQFDLNLPSNLPCVTGASRACSLGIEFLP